MTNEMWGFAALLAHWPKWRETRDAVEAKRPRRRIQIGPLIAALLMSNYRR